MATEAAVGIAIEELIRGLIRNKIFPGNPKRRGNKPMQNQQKKSKNSLQTRVQAGQSMRRGNQGLMQSSGFRARVATAPAARSFAVTKPAAKLGSRNTITVVHSEMIGQVNGSVAYSVLAYPVNPGTAVLWPWLATIASNFEFWRMVSARITYIPAAASSTTGIVGITVDYDPMDESPIDVTTFMNTTGAVQACPWDTVTLNINPTNANSNGSAGYKYVRVGGRDDTEELRLQDGGTVYLCTQGQGGTDAIGSLWAEYSIELKTPVAGNESVLTMYGHADTITPTDVLYQVLPVEPSHSVFYTDTASDTRFAISGQFFIMVYLTDTGGGLTSVFDFAACGTQQNNWFSMKTSTLDYACAGAAVVAQAGDLATITTTSAPSGTMTTRVVTVPCNFAILDAHF